MVCVHPINLKNGEKVACNRCPACRLQKTNEWVLRIMHELNYNKDSIFLTLTYNDEHLPKNMELKPDDLKNFWKRLRKETDKKIKYYACGEYGEKYRRPHYHAIVFGLSSLDKEKIEDAWRLGFVKIGTVTEQSIRYVASYIMDKDEAIEFKKFTGVMQAPFLRCSNGIGKKWAIDNKDLIAQDLYIKNKGIERAIPRYYVKLLGDEISISRKNERRVDKAIEHDNKLAKLKVNDLSRSIHDRDYRKQKEQELKHMTLVRKMSKKM